MLFNNNYFKMITFLILGINFKTLFLIDWKTSCVGVSLKFLLSERKCFEPNFYVIFFLIDFIIKVVLCSCLKVMAL